jgi:hypothetical protein
VIHHKAPKDHHTKQQFNKSPPQSEVVEELRALKELREQQDHQEQELKVLRAHKVRQE